MITDEQIREIARQLGFLWNGVWNVPEKEFRAAMIRACQIGHMYTPPMHPSHSQGYFDYD